MNIRRYIRQSKIFGTFAELIRPRGHVVDIFHPHLGGYKAGGDWATEATPLFEMFFSTYECRSALDVGCAEGVSVEAMLGIGIDAYGIEGLKKAVMKSRCRERLTVHDLTHKPYLSHNKYDLVWCSEVVEHIEERYVGNVVLTLAGNCRKYLAMSYGPPGSGGYHHVNCKPAEYWVQLIEGAGLLFDAQLTEQAKRVIVSSCRGYRHFAINGLIFQRKA